MSRTYRYPRESLDEPMTRDEPVANFRIQRKLEKQKHRKKMKVKIDRSFKMFISFRDQQRSRM